MGYNDTAAKSEGDLGEYSDRPVTIHPEESVIADLSQVLGEDKISLIVVNMT